MKITKKLAQLNLLITQAPQDLVGGWRSSTL